MPLRGRLTLMMHDMHAPLGTRTRRHVATRKPTCHVNVHVRVRYKNHLKNIFNYLKSKINSEKFLKNPYDIVDMDWIIRNLYQGKRWLTWSNYGILSVLRMKV